MGTRAVSKTHRTTLQQGRLAQRGARLFQLVRWGTILLLCISVAAKFVQLINDPTSSFVFQLGGHRWVLFAISVETILALMLIAEWDNAVAISTAVVVFLVFAFISGAFVLLGVSSCQCLGQVKTPPLGMFVLDLLVLTALVIRAIMLVRNKFPFRLSLLNFCLLLLIGVGFFFEVTVWGRNTAAAWRQASIITSQPIEFLGFADTDQPFNGKISIRNTTTETVTVAGFLPGRSVTQMESIPQPIAAGETATLKITLKKPKSPGIVADRIRLFLVSDKTAKVDVAYLLIAKANEKSNETHSSKTSLTK